MFCCFGPSKVHSQGGAHSLDLKKYGLTDDDLQSRQGLATAYHAFCSADRDGSGRLDKLEFARAFDLANNPYALRLHEMIDADNSGGIDFVEFLIGLTMFEGPKACKAERFIFQALDLNLDGMISSNECQQMLVREKQCLAGSRAKEKKSKAWDDHKSADKVAVKDLEQRYSKLLEEMHNMGFVKLPEWEPICGRFPQVFFPAQQVFSNMRLYSKAAAEVVSELRSKGVLAFQEKERKVMADGPKRPGASGLSGRVNRSFSKLGKAASGSFSKIKGRVTRDGRAAAGGRVRPGDARPGDSDNDVAQLSSLNDFDLTDADGDEPGADPQDSANLVEVARSRRGRREDKYSVDKRGGGKEERGRTLRGVATATMAADRMGRGRGRGRESDGPPPLERAYSKDRRELGARRESSGAEPGRVASGGARRESSGAEPSRYASGGAQRESSGGSPSYAPRGARRESSGGSPKHLRVRTSGEHEREKKNSLRRIMLRQASEAKHGAEAPMAAHEDRRFQRLSSGSGAEWSARAGGNGSFDESPSRRPVGGSPQFDRSGSMRGSRGDPTPPRRGGQGEGGRLKRIGSYGSAQSSPTYRRSEGSPSPFAVTRSSNSMTTPTRRSEGSPAVRGRGSHDDGSPHAGRRSQGASPVLTHGRSPSHRR